MPVEVKLRIPSRPGVLEDQHQHAVRGRDRKQVEPDREQRHDQRAEGEQQQQERQRQHEADDQRQGVAQLGAGVHRLRRLSRHADHELAPEPANAAGTMSWRSVFSAWMEALSVPLPMSPTLATATVWAGVDLAP